MVVKDKGQLIDVISSGVKPREQWRVGTEHESFLFHKKTGKSLPYHNDTLPSIEGVLGDFMMEGFQGVYEENSLIGVVGNGGSVTLEPAGQFELSGAPVKTLHDSAKELSCYLDILKRSACKRGFGAVSMGFHPYALRKEQPSVPKKRYDIMRAYMAKVGTLGLDMMLRTCTVQSNLDFSSETDMVLKFRVSLALQPIVTALFASSPFREGKLSGFQSTRGNVWQHTDKARSGLLPFVFEAGMSFERYVDYALDVPMYFVMREGRYIDVSGESFRTFLKGELKGYKGHKPTLEDWSAHLTTLFPDVRLKSYLEMRGADGGNTPKILALSALWAGLLYDRENLDGLWDEVQLWTLEERQKLIVECNRNGLHGQVNQLNVYALAQKIVRLAQQGLIRRAYKNEKGQDESIYLEPLLSLLRQKQTVATQMIALFNGGQSVKEIFESYSLFSDI